MSDSTKLAVMPALLLPFVVLLLVLNGCAAKPEKPAAPADLEAWLGQPLIGADCHGQILLQYSTSKEMACLGAAWPANNQTLDQRRSFPGRAAGRRAGP